MICKCLPGCHHGQQPAARPDVDRCHNCVAGCTLRLDRTCDRRLIGRIALVIQNLRDGCVGFDACHSVLTRDVLHAPHLAWTTQPVRPSVQYLLFTRLTWQFRMLACPLSHCGGRDFHRSLCFTMLRWLRSSCSAPCRSASGAGRRGAAAAVAGSKRNAADPRPGESEARCSVPGKASMHGVVSARRHTEGAGWCHASCKDVHDWR